MPSSSESQRAASFLKLIITGCPCSGTKYVCELLRDHSLDARHESLDYKKEEGVWWKPGGGDDPVIEVSYVMNHWLEFDPIKNVPVILLVRHPVKVINSWLAKGLAHDGTANAEEKMERCIGFNERTLAAPGLTYVHKIDVEPDSLLLKRVELVTGLKAEVPFSMISKETNAHNQGRLNLSYEDLCRVKNAQRFFRPYRMFYDL